MSNSNQNIILSFIEESLFDTDCFLVNFNVKPTNNYKVYIDSDSGFSLDKSIKINRFLRKKIEDANIHPDGNFSLEVSSPGVDVPLVLVRQYKKNIGRTIEIDFIDKDRKSVKGELLNVEDNHIYIKPILSKKNKKNLPIEIVNISFDEIKKAQVCIQF